MKSIAVIGDIAGSKNIRNRNDVQQRLQSGLNLVNRGNKSLTAPHRIILGDEFQSVYKNADRLLFDLIGILLSVYPHIIKFSIGIGDITARLEENSVIGMDGPAFYSAREGMTNLKKSSSLFLISSDMIENKLINHTLSLISEELKSWKESRLRIFTMLQSGFEIQTIAAELKLSQRAVYKSIKDGAIPTINDTFSEISAVINRSL